MEIQQLCYFLAAANCSSFAQAAKSCFTSRQNVAHAVSSLEREFGTALFERKGNRVQLTAAGQQAARQIDEILSRVDELSEMFVQSDTSPERLNIAVAYNILGRIPESAESFISEFDQDIDIFEVSAEECYNAVCSGQVDIGLELCMQRNFPDCAAEEISHLRAYAIVNKASSLANKNKISIHDLKRQRLQLMSDSSFQVEPLFAQLDALGYDFSNITIAKTGSALYGVKRNAAVGISTSLFVDYLPKDMQAIPLDDPQFNWCIYLLHSNDSARRSTIDRFSTGLRKSFSSQL